MKLKVGRIEEGSWKLFELHQSLKSSITSLFQPPTSILTINSI
ncbi:hypothetical protein [Chryseobacterium sp. T20]